MSLQKAWRQTSKRYTPRMLLIADTQVKEVLLMFDKDRMTGSICTLPLRKTMAT